MIEVTQADRDAAQALVSSGWTNAIEAFARHRIEATRQANAELVEFIRSAAEWTGEGPRTTPWRDIVKSIGNEARELLTKHGGKHD